MKRHHVTHRSNGRRHDSGHTLVEDAQALIETTAEITDEKVKEARDRLMAAVESTEEMYLDLRKRVEHSMQEHPYKALGVVFGVGALVGLYLGRRK